MCLIIASPEGKVPTCGVIEQGWKDNSDGWGLMHSNGSEIVINKGLNFDHLKPLLDNLNGSPYVLHYRWATHGNKNIDNCHPFRVAKQLYMAHNGVISIECSNKLMSDTWHFAKFLRESGVDKDAIKYKSVMKIIEDRIGKSNKLAFLDSTGNITFANENSGMWQDGVWFSNGNSFYSNDYGWDSYFKSKYSSRYGRYSKFSGSNYQRVTATESDEKWYEMGSDIWDTCEYCNNLDWLEESPDCDGMILCRPCKTVLSKVFAEDNQAATEVDKGWNNGSYIDSNGIPYTWNDIDERIEQVRQVHKDIKCFGTNCEPRLIEGGSTTTDKE